MTGFNTSAISNAGQTVATGFTLIEIMVVMLLVSIVLAVAVPRFDSGLLQDGRKLTTRRMTLMVKELRSKSIGEQTTVALVVDVSNDRYWIVDETMDDIAMAQAAETADKLPGDIHFAAVVFPNQQPIRSGNADIYFHPGGYTDQALIQMQSDDGQRFTYWVQPLLPTVKVVDQWIEF